MNRQNPATSEQDRSEQEAFERFARTILAATFLHAVVASGRAASLTPQPDLNGTSAEAYVNLAEALLNAFLARFPLPEVPS